MAYVQTLSWSDAGDNWDVSFKRGQSGQLLVLRSLGFTSIASAALTLAIKQYFTDAAPLLTKITGGGQITIADPNFTVFITQADMLSLPVGTYHYDVRRTDTGNEDTITWGRWRVYPSVGVL